MIFLELPDQFASDLAGRADEEDYGLLYQGDREIPRDFLLPGPEKQKDKRYERPKGEYLPELNRD